MTLPTPQQVAQDLAEIHEMPFGGKRRGRMKITRTRLRELSNRARLEEAFIQQLIVESRHEGLLLIDFDDHFVVIREQVMKRYRSVTKTVVNRFLAHKRNGLR